MKRRVFADADDPHGRVQRQVASRHQHHRLPVAVQVGRRVRLAPAMQVVQATVIRVALAAACLMPPVSRQAQTMAAVVAVQQAVCCLRQPRHCCGAVAFVARFEVTQALIVKKRASNR